jgi:hypothetical protein
LPNAPVGDITLKDCAFDGVTKPSIEEHTKSVKLDKVFVNGSQVREL